MITFVPYTIPESEVTTTATIAYDSAYFTAQGKTWQGEWSAGTYALADVVYSLTTLHLYESLSASNTDDPTSGAATWLDLGYVNTMRCFDEYVGEDYLALTTAASPLVMTLTTDQVANVGLWNVTADTVTVELLDGSDVSQWSIEYNLLDDALGIADWFDYRYAPYLSVLLRDIMTVLDYPTESGEGDKIRITLESDSGTVSLSNCFLGYAENQGNTKWDAEISAFNTGDVTQDSQGRTTYNPGENYRTIRATIRCPEGSSANVLRALSALQKNAGVYDFNNDSTDYDILRAYGAVTRISQRPRGIKNIEVDVEIRGIVKKEEIS